MSNHIGIVMGGYLDENENLMDRHELNRRISSIQKENKQLREKIVYLKRKIEVAVEGIETIKNWAEINLDPNNGQFECRGDEDCDHCHGLGTILKLDEALKEIKDI